MAGWESHLYYTAMLSFDYVLVGGGLQSALLALALRARRPRSTIALLERDSRLGGNHTWCFHGSDVPAGSESWLEPLVAIRWTGYRVLFPDRHHTMDVEYAGVTSERLHSVVSSALGNHPGSELRTRSEAVSLSSDRVLLQGGEELRARVVIDARGPGRSNKSRGVGYQKFLGLEAALDGPHGLDRPILMDATVDQSEGFRFFYVLPFDERTLLVEDTYFHESPVLDKDRIRDEVRAYMERRGWQVAAVRREESGVLPMPWAGGIEASSWRPSGPLVAGYRGGWFHPGTGYSFPVALRLAEFVANRPPEELFGAELDRFCRRHRRQTFFARFLNRLLFRWYPPRARLFVFERFYRLPDTTVENWYALRLRWHDALRMVIGRPPRGLSLRHRLASSAP